MQTILLPKCEYLNTSKEIHQPSQYAIPSSQFITTDKFCVYSVTSY